MEEYIYDKYSPVMYGIALQISSYQDEAEQILIATFQKIDKLKLAGKHDSGLCVKLIKLTIETAFEQFPKYKRDHLVLKQLHQSPTLNRVLCESISIKTICRRDKLSRSQSMKNLYTELSSFLNVKSPYSVKTILIPGGEISVVNKHPGIIPAEEILPVKIEGYTQANRSLTTTSLLPGT